MTFASFLLPATAALLVAAVLVIWRLHARVRGLQATLNERRAEAQLPNRGTKFRIVYYTDIGAKARDFFSTVTTGGADLAEFWHYDILRDKK